MHGRYNYNNKIFLKYISNKFSKFCVYLSDFYFLLDNIYIFSNCWIYITYKSFDMNYKLRFLQFINFKVAIAQWTETIIKIGLHENFKFYAYFRLKMKVTHYH